MSYSVMFRNVYGMRFRIGLRVYRFRGAAIAYDRGTMQGLAICRKIETLVARLIETYRI